MGKILDVSLQGTDTVTMNISGTNVQLPYFELDRAYWKLFDLHSLAVMNKVRGDGRR